MATAIGVLADGEWWLHAPIDTELARELVAAFEHEGYHPNVYVGDELYVSKVTPYAESYAAFQQIPIHAVLGEGVEVVRRANDARVVIHHRAAQ